MGREARWGTTKIGETSTPHRVLVVGGGPGGLKFAETAAIRGHNVTLVERGDALGGQVRLAAKLPGRSRWDHLIEDLSGSLARLGVSIDLGSEATLDTVRGFDADLTVLATGSHFDKTGFSIFRPDRASIPGAGEGRVLDPIDVVTDVDRVGARVVLIDDVGGASALGLALMLAEAGRDVHIVTMAPFVGAEATTTYDAQAFYIPALAKAGAHFHASTTVVSIEDAAVNVADIYTRQAQTIEADSVVVNMLRRPEESLYRALRTASVAVRRIGDCVAPRRIDEAIYEGMELGLGLEDAVAGAERPAALAV